MTLEQAVRKIPSLKNASIVAGQGGLSSEITGVMVLEAPDIENWGREGLLLLSSYYAFQEMRPEALGSFLIQCRQIGICGILLKTGRLIADVPSFFIESCNNLSIPLITLPSDTHYEDIVISILEPIINRLSEEQTRAQHEAELMSALLGGELRTVAEISDALNSLGLLGTPHYQVLLLDTVGVKEHLTAKDEGRAAASALSSAESRIRSQHPHLTAQRTSRGLTILIGLLNESDGFNADSLTRLLQPETEKLSRLRLSLRAVISSVGERSRISDLNREALDTRMIMNINGRTSYIADYDSLGIYKLFTDEDRLSLLPGLIHPKYSSLKNTRPELWETLSTYLDCSRSYKETASKLFLHPKTVKYRIDLIRNVYGINLDDSEELFEILLNIRLFRILDNTAGALK